jgi:hypothetical protein
MLRMQQGWRFPILLNFINSFFGMIIDRMRLTDGQKELTSWSFLIAAIFGGAIRMILVILSALGELGLYASLGETIFISLGTLVFLLGQSHRLAPEQTGSLVK